MIWANINKGRSWESADYKIHFCIHGWELWSKNPFMCINRSIGSLATAKHLAEMMAENVSDEARIGDRANPATLLGGNQ